MLLLLVCDCRSFDLFKTFSTIMQFSGPFTQVSFHNGAPFVSGPGPALASTLPSASVFPSAAWAPPCPQAPFVYNGDAPQSFPGQQPPVPVAAAPFPAQYDAGAGYPPAPAPMPAPAPVMFPQTSVTVGQRGVKRMSTAIECADESDSKRPKFATAALDNEGCTDEQNTVRFLLGGRFTDQQLAAFADHPQERTAFLTKIGALGRATKRRGKVQHSPQQQMVLEKAAKAARTNREANKALGPAKRMERVKTLDSMQAKRESLHRAMAQLNLQFEVLNFQEDLLMIVVREDIMMDVRDVSTKIEVESEKERKVQLDNECKLNALQRKMDRVSASSLPLPSLGSGMIALPSPSAFPLLAPSVAPSLLAFPSASPSPSSSLSCAFPPTECGSLSSLQCEVPPFVPASFSADFHPSCPSQTDWMPALDGGSASSSFSDDDDTSEDLSATATADDADHQKFKYENYHLDENGVEVLPSD